MVSYIRTAIVAFFGLLVCASMPAIGKTNELANVPSSNQLIWILKDFRKWTDTNGLVLDLKINNFRTQHVCEVCVLNQSTNKFLLWRSYQASWLKVELFDAKGRLVEKTEIGKEFGKPMNVAQLHEMIQTRYLKYRAGRYRTPGFSPILPRSRPFVSFDPSELFKSMQPGEYKLHIRIPLIRCVWDTEPNPEFKIIWLPEVVATIEIREVEVGGATKP